MSDILFIPLKYINNNTKEHNDWVFACPFLYEIVFILVNREVKASCINHVPEYVSGGVGAGCGDGFYNAEDVLGQSHKLQLKIILLFYLYKKLPAVE